MQLSALEPFIPSGKDFALARQFFCDLGFTVRWEGGGYAGLAFGDAAFILQELDDPHVQQNLMMFVQVDDLDAWWDHLRGIVERYPQTRANPPKDMPWGLREVHLIDPAGVCWHFGQR